MRPLRVLLAFLTAVLVSLTAARGPVGGPEWLDDPDEAFARAAESGRPLLIVFR